MTREQNKDDRAMLRDERAGLQTALVLAQQREKATLSVVIRFRHAAETRASRQAESQAVVRGIRAKAVACEVAADLSGTALASMDAAVEQATSKADQSRAAAAAQEAVAKAESLEEETEALHAQEEALKAKPSP